MKLAKRIPCCDCLVPAVALAMALLAADARAQSSSLFGNPGTRKPLTMADASWTYQPPPEPKHYKVNEFITVMIEEKTRMTSEGQVDQRKKVEGSLSITDWISLHGLSVVPAVQEGGDPKVGGILDNKYRAQANLQNRDMFESSVQCVITDIRPNGTLVLEGHSRVKIDDEEWDLSISGIIRPEDILPNNSVKSEKMAEKRIERRSTGHGRDGIRRGFIQKMIDRYQPF